MLRESEAGAWGLAAGAVVGAGAGIVAGAAGAGAADEAVGVGAGAAAGVGDAAGAAAGAAGADGVCGVAETAWFTADVGAPTGAPQREQNLESSGSWLPHCVQNMAPPFSGTGPDF
nr:hypothetical protein [Enorma massiliensis]